MKWFTLLTFISCLMGSTIEDQEKPTVNCLQGVELELMEVTGTVTITANDLDHGSSDNQTKYKHLKFSFSSNKHDILRTFDCSDTGKKRIKFWVTDQAGNQSYGETFLIIKDPNKVCGVTIRSVGLACSKADSES